MLHLNPFIKSFSPVNINFVYCFFSKFYFSYSVLENYKSTYKMCCPCTCILSKIVLKHLRFQRNAAGYRMYFFPSRFYISNGFYKHIWFSTARTYLYEI